MVTKKPKTSELLARLADLEDRVAKLEAARDAAVLGLVPSSDPRARRPLAAGQEARTTQLAGPASPGLSEVEGSPAGVPAPATPRGEVTEEVMLVIAATVAAFLGERAHVRQVRLLSSEAWAQQGRVSVMASHRWAVHR